MKINFLRLVVLVSVLTAANTSAQDGTQKPKRDPEKMFASIDTDADGKISKDEAAKAERPMLSKRFDEIDTNKDTYLDKDELKAFREKQRANRKQKQE